MMIDEKKNMYQNLGALGYGFAYLLETMSLSIESYQNLGALGYGFAYLLETMGLSIESYQKPP